MESNSGNRRRPKRKLKIEADGYKAEEVPLDGVHRLVVLRGMELQPPQELEQVIHKLSERLGKHTLVLVLPKEASLEVFDLLANGDEEPGKLGRRTAPWGF